MTATLFIDGAVGTTGLEIAQRLEGRSEFARITLPDDKRKDEAARREALNDADYVILCLPDDAAVTASAMVENPRTKIIDASSAHRTADGWTYGFPEFRSGQRSAIAASMRISNPGCYPTGFLALIAPLIAGGLIPADTPITCNAVSGYSGGGKALINRFQDEGDIGFRTYGLNMGHKHVPEMTRYSGLSHAPLFAPSVVDAFRGMLVEIPLIRTSAMASGDDMRSALAAHYDGERMVRAAPLPDSGELLLRDNDDASDALTLYVAGDEQHIRLIAMLDNLGKGASGAAVQNLNIAAGLDEFSGLRV